MLKGRKAAVAALAAVASISFSGVAVAASGQDADNGNAPLLRGTAHCVNGVPGTDSGVVVAHTNVIQNDTRVHVTLRDGVPDSTYYVAIACRRYIGSLTTNDQGIGTANIDAPGVEAGPFYVDLGIGGGTVFNTIDYRIAGPFIGG